MLATIQTATIQAPNWPDLLESQCLKADLSSKALYGIFAEKGPLGIFKGLGFRVRGSRNIRGLCASLLGNIQQSFQETPNVQLQLVHRRLEDLLRPRAPEKMWASMGEPN